MSGNHHRIPHFLVSISHSLLLVAGMYRRKLDIESSTVCTYTYQGYVYANVEGLDLFHQVDTGSMMRPYKDNIDYQFHLWSGPTYVSVEIWLHMQLKSCPTFVETHPLMVSRMVPLH